MSTKIIGIYKITSPTNRIYIGSSVDVMARIYNYKILRCKTQPRLYNSLLKYGWINHEFEIIETCNVEDLYSREAYYGDMYNVLESGLNCRLPKTDEFKISLSTETKKKISNANKGLNLGGTKGWTNNSMKSLTKENVIEIKKLLIENELTQKEISKLFNVSRKTISNISTKKCYKSVEPDMDMTKNKKMYIKLNKDDYAEILKLNEDGISQKKISIMFGVHQSHISRIINEPNYIKTI